MKFIESAVGGVRNQLVEDMFHHAYNYTINIIMKWSNSFENEKLKIIHHICVRFFDCENFP